jgi:hypothetical protein
MEGGMFASLELKDELYIFALSRERERERARAHAHTHTHTHTHTLHVIPGVVVDQFGTKPYTMYRIIFRKIQVL